MTTSAVILAAGQGTRFNSNTPKVLHLLGGKPLIERVLETIAFVTGTTPVLVVGYGREAVRSTIGERVVYVTQEQQLGTGHAVGQARCILNGNSSYVLVVFADMPLLRSGTIQSIVEKQKLNSGPVTILTVETPHLTDFGRVVRDATNQVSEIIEVNHATPEQRLIQEKNVGVFCFQADWLWRTLPALPPSSKGEYYLTDLIGLATRDGGRVETVILEDPSEAIGINTRAQLAEAEGILRNRINSRWMDAGVTMLDPATIYIESSVQLGRDVRLLPNTHLCGNTVIGDYSIVGPNAVIVDSVVGERCKVNSSVLEKATLENLVDVGPFAHLRPGAYLEEGVHIGNFGEVKNARLGRDVKMGHFSYISDSTVGKKVNIGAGTVTCNFDGINKHHTTIGDEAFIGSGTRLVAPVTVGNHAHTGAGAVVIDDVPEKALVVGVPAHIIKVDGIRVGPTARKPLKPRKTRQYNAQASRHTNGASRFEKNALVTVSFVEPPIQMGAKLPQTLIITPEPIRE